MKKGQRILLAFAVMMSCGIYSASAQIFVNIRPARVVTVRTIAPSPRQVWIEEDWRENNGRYEWSGGHWEAPPSGNVVYRNGYWRHSNRGDQWVRGGWNNSNGYRGKGHGNGRGNGHGNGHGNGRGHSDHR